MTKAISGAVIIREGEGAYTHEVLYRQRCDNCRGFAVYPPVSSVQMLSDGLTKGVPSGVYGTYHLERFDCLFCGNRQIVELER
jgi:hypothetical protein